MDCDILHFTHSNIYLIGARLPSKTNDKWLAKKARTVQLSQDNVKLMHCRVPDILQQNMLQI